MYQKLYCFLFVFLCFSTHLLAQELPNWIAGLAPAVPSRPNESLTITPEGFFLIIVAGKPNKQGAFQYNPDHFIQINYLDRIKPDAPFQIIESIGRDQVTILDASMQPITYQPFTVSYAQRYIKVPIPIFRTFPKNKIWIQIKYKNPTTLTLQSWQSNEPFNYSPL